MSIENEAVITCPKCHQEHPFTTWDSVNVTLDPEKKEAVLNGSAFLFECPDCGEKTMINYRMLYHDMERNIMIQYAVSDDEAVEAYNSLTDNGPASMIGSLKSDYILRIVRTQNELCEKIRIFDAGLDDRIIELAKLFMLAHYQQDYADEKPIEIYFTKEEEKNILIVYVGGEYKGGYVMPDDFYDKIYKGYVDKIPDIRKDGLFIDRQWAIETISQEKGH